VTFGPSDGPEAAGTIVGVTTVSRRRLLLTAALLPGAALAAHLVTGLDRAAASIRPPADGSSSRRCAACGSPAHTMLDGRCPAQPGAAALRNR
jgi:hypothetical protein